MRSACFVLSTLLANRASATTMWLGVVAGAGSVIACADDPASPRTIAEAEVFTRGQVIWFAPDTVGAWRMHPLLDGARVYFSRDLLLSPSGDVAEPAELRALDAVTGAVLWKAPITSAHNAAIAGGVVAPVWGSLPMFERSDGSLARIFTYESSPLSSNVISDRSRFYVGSHNGHVLAIDPVRGQVEWDIDLAGSASTTTFGLALAGDALAVTLKHFRSGGTGADSGIVAVLDVATGALRWRVAVGDGENPGITDAPVIASGLVAAVTHALEVHAFDLATGARRWRQLPASTGSGYGSSGLTACDEMVIAPTADLGLVALDAATGVVRWRVGDLQAGSLFSLECSFGTVIALGSNMRVVDARTGAVRARYPRDELSEVHITSATRDETSLYVGTSLGYARVGAP